MKEILRETFLAQVRSQMPFGGMLFYDFKMFFGFIMVMALVANAFRLNAVLRLSLKGTFKVLLYKSQMPFGGMLFYDSVVSEAIKAVLLLGRKCLSAECGFTIG